MSEGADLLTTIQAAPDEDAPRLLFADWLRQRGDPRGDFIRAQVEAARLNEDDPRRTDQRTEAFHRLVAHEDEWVAPFRPILANWRFQRGFVERILIDAQDFIAHAERLFRWMPIREVRLYGARGHTQALAACAELGHLHGLSLVPHPFGETRSDIGDTGLEELAASPHWARLRSLDLEENEIGPAGIAALARSPLLARLEELNLHSNPVGREGLQILAGSPSAARLRRLDLSELNLAEAEFAVLAASPLVTGLEELELFANPVDAPAMRRLVGAEHLRNVK